MLECDGCGERYSQGINIHVCECGEPLRPEYFSGDIKKLGNVWKNYADFFPLEVERDLTLGEGKTPLSKAPRISKNLDVNLHLKNETMNPTWSFKDRGTILSLERAINLGKTKLGTVSTGNMAASVSAYGARNDIETFVLVPSEISDKKISQIQSYGPTIIKVDGDYGDLYYESFDIADQNIYFTNSNSPFKVEGYKTIAFEIFEEIETDYIIIPTSSGGLFRGIMKGLTELKMSGVIDDIPTLISVQAEGCSPICEAYKSGKKEIRRSEPDTLAGAISNPYPPGGNDVLSKLEENDGLCEKVSDEDIITAREEIAKEGIYCQPSSAVGVAALKNLRKQDRIEKGVDVVSIITGSGLKTGPTEDVDREIFQCDLDDLKTCISRFF